MKTILLSIILMSQSAFSTTLKDSDLTLLIDEVHDKESAIEIYKAIDADASRRIEAADRKLIKSPCNPKILELLRNASDDYKMIQEIGNMKSHYELNDEEAQTFDDMLNFGKKKEATINNRILSEEDAFTTRCATS